MRKFYASAYKTGIIFLLLLLFLGCSSPETAPDTGTRMKTVSGSHTPLKRLAVIGVKNDIHHPDWENRLIAYGISHLLAQKLFARGGYAPVEDNPEIIEEIDRLVALQWDKATPLPAPPAADQAAARFSCDAVAYARLKDFFTTRKSAFAGPFSKAVTRITVEIEVYIKETGKPARMSTGTGSAETRSSGVLFQIRKDRIYFDETAVGQATQEAIVNAVKGL